MEALKWVGYIVAAIAVLCLVASLGFAVALLAAIGGAIICFALIVYVLAEIIKGLVESSRGSG